MADEGKIKLNSRSITDFQDSMVSKDSVDVKYAAKSAFCVGVINLLFRNIISTLSIMIRPSQTN